MTPLRCLVSPFQARTRGEGTMGFWTRGARQIQSCIQRPKFITNSTCRRTILTPTVEPPVNVVERPFALVLSEDPGFYPQNSSWRKCFQQEFPQRHGISYATHQFSGMVNSFDAAVSELKMDLASGDQPPPVLVARGPWISWVAQFYLESLPLAGLIMVDPLPLDDTKGIDQFQSYFRERGLDQTREYRMFQEFQEHWGHWMLQLEAGSVPMGVFYTVNRPGFQRCAESTAYRHSLSDGPFGAVCAEQIPLMNSPEEHAQEAMEYFHEWLDEHVL